MRARRIVWILLFAAALSVGAAATVVAWVPMAQGATADGQAATDE